jgi:hypothetical protein
VFVVDIGGAPHAALQDGRWLSAFRLGVPFDVCCWPVKVVAAWLPAAEPERTRAARSPEIAIGRELPSFELLHEV